MYLVISASSIPLFFNFNFKKKIPVTKIVVYYSGCLPGISAIFPNGKTYRVEGKNENSVIKLQMIIPQTVTDKLELNIDQRILGEKLIISEIEIWGNSNKRDEK